MLLAGFVNLPVSIHSTGSLSFHVEPPGAATLDRGEGGGKEKERRNDLAGSFLSLRSVRF